MTDESGYMEYDLSSLKKLRELDGKESERLFINYFETKGNYKFKTAVEFKELDNVLIDNIYLVMNNDPRRKGKKIFFTGSAVECNKNELLDFIKGPVEKHDLIIPLVIIPVKNGNPPDYIITAQEDSIFEVMVNR